MSGLRITMMMMSHLEFHELEVESSENIEDVFEDLKQVGKDQNDAAGKPCGVCQKQFGNCGLVLLHGGMHLQPGALNLIHIN